jgi:hypothetical protein
MIIMWLRGRHGEKKSLVITISVGRRLAVLSAYAQDERDCMSGGHKEMSSILADQ